MSKVWIYQADRFLKEEEVQHISSEINEFVSSWTAHGSALAGSGRVEYGLFVVLEVDEEQAGVTGCSVDKSVHFLKALGTKYNVDFFNRLKVSFRDHEDKVRLVDREDFVALISSGMVNAETIVFNNLVQNSEELQLNWQIPFKDSWHSKVF